MMELIMNICLLNDSSEINCLNVLFLGSSNSPGLPVGPVIGGGIVGVVLLALCIAAGVYFGKRNNGADLKIFLIFIYPFI